MTCFFSSDSEIQGVSAGLEVLRSDTWKASRAQDEDNQRFEQIKSLMESLKARLYT